MVCCPERHHGHYPSQATVPGLAGACPAIHKHLAGALGMPSACRSGLRGAIWPWRLGHAPKPAWLCDVAKLGPARSAGSEAQGRGAADAAFTWGGH